MRLHPSERNEWIEDSLPHLSTLKRDQHFDIVLLVAVWQHVAPEHRLTAMRRLRNLIKWSGRLIMSVRHGPGASSRRCFECSDPGTVSLASDCGFDLIDSRSTDSIQQSNRDGGVRWTWLALAARAVGRNEP
jgi:hypothetical protein